MPTSPTPTGRIALPGHYAIAMFKDPTHPYFMTAVGGGGVTTNAIHTDATLIQSWEKFRFINGGPTDPNFAIQTMNGHLLTAQDGGGHTANAIRTNETAVNAWELFIFRPQSGPGFSPHFAIQTPKHTFFTAVSHGGQATPDAIHTDATAVSAWELFDFVKCDDPGTNATYSLEGILPSGGSAGYLNAKDGGRHSDSASLTMQPGPSYMLAFTLILQPGGTYAFKTSSGYYVTANAGGLVGQSYRTDTPQVNNWEKFTLNFYDDCTATIRTYSGTYMSMVPGPSPSQPIAIGNVADAAKATRWRLWVMAFYA